MRERKEGDVGRKRRTEKEGGRGRTEKQKNQITVGRRSQPVISSVGYSCSLGRSFVSFFLSQRIEHCDARAQNQKIQM